MSSGIFVPSSPLSWSGLTNNSRPLPLDLAELRQGRNWICGRCNECCTDRERFPFFGKKTWTKHRTEKYQASSTHSLSSADRMSPEARYDLGWFAVNRGNRLECSCEATNWFGVLDVGGYRRALCDFHCWKQLEAENPLEKIRLVFRLGHRGKSDA